MDKHLVPGYICYNSEIVYVCILVIRRVIRAHLGPLFIQSTMTRLPSLELIWICAENFLVPVPDSPFSVEKVLFGV